MKVQESGWSVKAINKRSKIQIIWFGRQQKLRDSAHFSPLRRKAPKRKVQLNHNGSAASMSLPILDDFEYPLYSLPLKGNRMAKNGQE
jgi:hypothetical protein